MRWRRQKQNLQVSTAASQCTIHVPCPPPGICSTLTPAVTLRTLCRKQRLSDLGHGAMKPRCHDTPVSTRWHFCPGRVRASVSTRGGRDKTNAVRVRALAYFVHAAWKQVHKHRDQAARAGPRCAQRHFATLALLTGLTVSSELCLHTCIPTYCRALDPERGITPTMSSSQMASNNISPARPPVSSRSLTRMRSLSLRERAMQPMFVATLRHSRQTRGTVVDHSMKPAKREFRSTKCACTHVCMQCVCMQCTHEHHARVKSACRVQVSRMHVVCMYVCKCA